MSTTIVSLTSQPSELRVLDPDAAMHATVLARWGDAASVFMRRDLAEKLHAQLGAVLRDPEDPDPFDRDHDRAEDDIILEMASYRQELNTDPAA